MSEAAKPKILIVEGRFYDNIADSLLNGAKTVLESEGYDCEVVTVPGAFEVPATIRFAIRSMEVGAATTRYAGFVALGCVIRGETDHYDHICRETSRALMDISVRYSVAIGFGILTCESREQAEYRADPNGKKDAGGAAGRACVRMMELKRKFRLVPR